MKKTRRKQAFNQKNLIQEPKMQRGASVSAAFQTDIRNLKQRFRNRGELLEQVQEKIKLAKTTRKQFIRPAEVNDDERVHKQ